jgi:hypothetical protein
MVDDDERVSRVQEQCAVDSEGLETQHPHAVDDDDVGLVDVAEVTSEVRCITPGRADFGTHVHERRDGPGSQVVEERRALATHHVSGRLPERHGPTGGAVQGAFSDRSGEGRVDRRSRPASDAELSWTVRDVGGVSGSMRHVPNDGELGRSSAAPVDNPSHEFGIRGTSSERIVPNWCP